MRNFYWLYLITCGLIFLLLAWPFYRDYQACSQASINAITMGENGTVAEKIAADARADEICATSGMRAMVLNKLFSGQ